MIDAKCVDENRQWEIAKPRKLSFAKTVKPDISSKEKFEANRRLIACQGKGFVNAFLIK